MTMQLVDLPSQTSVCRESLSRTTRCGRGGLHVIVKPFSQQQRKTRSIYDPCEEEGKCQLCLTGDARNRENN